MEPHPFEVHDSPENKRTVSTQGDMPTAGDEQVYDGEDRVLQSDPIATHRHGSTSRLNEMADEASGDAGGYTTGATGPDGLGRETSQS